MFKIIRRELLSVHVVHVHVHVTYRVVYFTADVNRLTAHNVANKPRDIRIYCITNNVNYDVLMNRVGASGSIQLITICVTSKLFMTSRLAP